MRMRRARNKVNKVATSPITFYNQGRPHSALDSQTPDMVYFALLPQLETA
jgi:hypothetical protein